MPRKKKIDARESVAFESVDRDNPEAAIQAPVRESMQSYAMRIWEGQSPDLPIHVRKERIITALVNQGYDPTGLELPA